MLNQIEVDALIKLSQENLRHPREQVRFIIRRDLRNSSAAPAVYGSTQQETQEKQF